MIPLVWRPIIMGVCFIAGVADPAVWIVMVLVILGLMGAHLREVTRR